MRNIEITCSENFSLYSYGLMTYCQENDSWAIVRRYHSIEFVKLMRFDFPIHKLEYIMFRITKDEKDKFKQFVETRDIKILKENGIGIDEISIKHINFMHDKYKDLILYYINLDTVNSEELKWTWPKGLKNSMEDPRKCAFREFEEEMGIKIVEENIVFDNWNKPIKQYYISPIDRIKIHNIFFPLVIKKIDNENLDEKVDYEVSAKKWVKIDELEKYIELSSTELEYLKYINQKFMLLNQ